MPLWGNDDLKGLSGTFLGVTQNDPNVVGVAADTLFLTELTAGETLFLSGVEYRIKSITDDHNLVLETDYAGTSGNLNISSAVSANEQPKYIAISELADVYGISEAEAQNATNRAKGIDTPGWVKYTTYTDAQGNTRHKAECLVAFSGIQGDADGTTFPQ